MRVLDPHAPLHPLPLKKGRGKKKRKPPSIESFFKCRMKVPLGDEREPGRYDNDWAPNIKGPEGKRDEVEVSITGYVEHYKEGAEWPAYYIRVWGDDDMGMEKTYFYHETNPEILLRLVLAFPEPLTIDYLGSLGFVGI